MKRYCIECADRKGLSPCKEEPAWTKANCWGCDTILYVLKESDYEDERQGRFTSKLFYPEVS